MVVVAAEELQRDSWMDSFGEWPPSAGESAVSVDCAGLFVGRPAIVTMHS